MQRTIEVEIPEHIEEDRFEDYLMGCQDEYEEALDISVSQYDSRAELDDVEISSVEIDETSAIITYDVTCSWHYGCRDMCGTDVEQRSVTATRQGRVFTFKEHIYLEHPSTFEEF